MSSQFIKQTEDFTCLSCGVKVVGNGYTNHCPKCLWSQHVDINPGDRAEACHGPMKPIGVGKKGESFAITHQCQVCGQERTTKAAENDDLAGFLDAML